MPKSSAPKLLALAVVVVIVAIGGIVLAVCLAGGAFRAVQNGFAGTCDAIDVAGVTRDIQLDRERGVAYLTFLERDTGRGTVMLLDLNLARPAPRAAMSHDPPDFRPAGISLWRRPGEPAQLFASSTPDVGVPAMEIATQDASGAFVPRATVRDELFGNAVRLAAIGTDQFFLIDHRPPRPGIRRLLSLLTHTGDDALVAFRAGQATVVDQGLAWASGIAASPDGSHLYVTELLARRLRIYRLNAGVPTLERRVALDLPPGAMTVDEDGEIWMTAYPRLLRYFANLEDADAGAPTVLVRFDPRRPEARPVEVFSDDGGRISAGGSVVRWRDTLVIGSPSQRKVLICKQNP